MNALADFPFSTDGWHPALAEMMPQIWMGFVLLIVGFVAYFLGYIAKRLVRSFGQSLYASEEEFHGTSWDLAAPVIQLLVFLFLFSGAAELVGFDFGDQLISFWPRAAAGLVIIGSAVMLATWINRSIRAYGKRANARNAVDDTLVGFTASTIRYTILGIAILAAMTQFGFAPGSLIAIVGAAGIAIALALQDTLKAVAAGFMLAAFRPFRIGDWVMLDEHEGAVEEITPFTTTISQVDNKIVQLTNDRVWGSAILNFTRLKNRRLDLYFKVHFDSDLDQVLDLLKNIANEHAEILMPDQTWSGVHELGDWAVIVRLRAWTPSDKFIQVRADLIKAVKQGFDQAGVDIPYPHQVEKQVS